MNEVKLQDQVHKFREIARHLPQIEIPTQHFLMDGMYVRQTFIRAGTAFVGRVHKKFHFFMVLKGRAEVTFDNEVKTIYAGMTLMCPPGTRRAGITLEDTVFAGVFRTDETELKSIEEDLTEYDPATSYGVGNVILPHVVKYEPTS